MSLSVLDFIGLFSGLCSIIALLLFLATLPRSKRPLHLLAALILIGLPLIAFVDKTHVWIMDSAIVVCLAAAVVFAYLYGKRKTGSHHGILDILLVSSKRTSGQEWILERVREARGGIISIDCFGVKLDVLYKILKGVASKSKLPYDSDVTMRALLLEVDSFGVKSRARLEGNDKIIRDVALMRDVYIELVKDYERHPSHRLMVKTYDFTPGFYILRVNDRMLIGTYLAESGYDCLCVHLRRHDGNVFNQFTRFFDAVWNNYSKDILTPSQKNPAG